MEPKIHAAIYARCSTLLGQDLNNQLVPLRSLAEHRGFTIAGEYRDEGVSGSKERRPGLDQLLKDAYLGKFSVVLVTALDRIGRDVRHTVNLLHELNTIGVSLVSQSQAIDFSTPLGKATLVILSAIASMEMENTRIRIREAIATKRLLAQRNGTKFLIGRPVAADAGTRKKILALYREGHSIRSIQRLLEKRIGHSTIGRIIREYRVQPIAQCGANDG